jgi:hypothetical protein
VGKFRITVPVSPFAPLVYPAGQWVHESNYPIFSIADGRVMQRVHEIEHFKILISDNFILHLIALDPVPGPGIPLSRYMSHLSVASRAPWSISPFPDKPSRDVPIIRHVKFGMHEARSATAYSPFHRLAPGRVRNFRSFGRQGCRS